MVTVTAPAEPMTPTEPPAEPATPVEPPMLTVADKKATLAGGGFATLAVMATDTVIILDSTGVLEVSKTTTTTYKVTAKKKGSATIQVYNEANALLGTIVVTVSNSAPKITTKVADPRYRLDVIMSPMELTPLDVYTLDVDLNEFFTDSDGDGLPLPLSRRIREMRL